jgi:hypothetical protein
MLLNIQKSIMSIQKSFQMQINNKHLKEKFITIITINKLTALFLFDEFYSVTPANPRPPSYGCSFSPSLPLLVFVPPPIIFVQQLAIKSKQISTHKNMYLETDVK